MKAHRLITGFLAAAMLLVVAYAFAQGPGGPAGPPDAPGRPPGPGRPGMHGQMFRRMMFERVERALDRASVTPEQRVKIYAARDRVAAAIDAQAADPRGQRDRMLALFEGDTLTAGQLQALHQQQDQRRQAIRAAIDQAVIDVHDTLTPAQRKIVAEYMNSHAPHGFRGPHGFAWPHGPREPGSAGPGGMPAPEGMR